MVGIIDNKWKPPLLLLNLLKQCRQKPSKEQSKRITRSVAGKKRCNQPLFPPPSSHTQRNVLKVRCGKKRNAEDAFNIARSLESPRRLAMSHVIHQFPKVQANTHSLPLLMYLSSIMPMSAKTNLHTMKPKNSAACRALNSSPTWVGEECLSPGSST